MSMIPSAAAGRGLKTHLRKTATEAAETESRWVPDGEKVLMH